MVAALGKFPSEGELVALPLNLACNERWPSAQRDLNNKQTPNCKSVLKYQKKVPSTSVCESKNKTQW